MGSAPEGHVFISYVREDAQRVDAIQLELVRAGVRVWRDTADLWPGEDWRARIRQAITEEALVFVACFSEAAAARRVSGQNEELMLAVEQLRARRPDDPWLIPVRLDDSEVPFYDIGGGRTLDVLQRVDLFGGREEAGMARLVAGVRRVLGAGIPPSAVRDHDVGEMVASEQQIAERVAAMGEALTTAYSGRNPVVVSVLPDAAIFASDLVRRIDTPLEEDSMGVEVISRAIRVTKDLDSDIEGRSVLVLAADVRGENHMAMSYLLRNMGSRRPVSLDICALLGDEVSARDLWVTYLGFEVRAGGVVGYGIRRAGRYTNLPYVAWYAPKGVPPAG